VAVLGVARGPDPEDPWSRTLNLSVPPLPERFTFALPGPLEFYGDDHARHAFHDAVDSSKASAANQSASISLCSWKPLHCSTKDLGGGAAGSDPAVLRKPSRSGAPGGTQDHRGGIRILGRGLVFRLDQAGGAEKARSWTLDRADVLVVPTSPTIYTIKEVLANRS